MPFFDKKISKIYQPDHNYDRERSSSSVSGLQFRKWKSLVSPPSKLKVRPVARCFFFTGWCGLTSRQTKWGWRGKSLRGWGGGREPWLSETKPSEMARNAFKTNMVWWNLNSITNKKRRHKKNFSPQNAWYNNNSIFSEPLTLFDNGSLTPCWTKAADARTKEKKNSNSICDTWAGCTAG